MKLAYDAACNSAKPMCSASSYEIALELSDERRQTFGGGIMTNAFIRSVCQKAHSLVFLRDVANEQNFSRFCPRARHSAARVVFSIYCRDECEMSREDEETKKSHAGIAHEKGPRINRHVDGEFDSLIVRATIYLSWQGGLGNSKLPVVGIQLSLKRISELSRSGRRGDQEEHLLQEMETEAVDRVHMYSIKVPTCLRPSNWGV
ncbi:hypothetical protein ALC60_03291 [Trachymyrmex zeteki]|uniref:Uncharacterized protein n=1 Tax=Mycetomoellerius zeteki TaxID=64791 RepID=A0A151XBX4_9HYME|nr:hypothetical protein ALC60_03291 [Trachymyrmex zeteki]